MKPLNEGSLSRGPAIYTYKYKDYDYEYIYNEIEGACTTFPRWLELSDMPISLGRCLELSRRDAVDT